MNKQKIFSINKYVLWFGLILTMAFYFFTQTYSDLDFVMDMVYKLLDGIFSGHVQAGMNQIEWLYGISVYAMLLIWMIPVWIIIHAFHLEVASVLISFPAILWFKILIFIFSLLCVYVVFKIANVICKEVEQWWVVFVYLSSSLYILPVLSISQFDSFEIFFLLLAIYYCIKDDNKKFIWCFAIANAMKLFTLMIFVPLLLFKEKKLIKIMIGFLEGCSVILLDKVLIYFASTQSSVGREKTAWFIKQIFAYKVNLGFDISIFLLFYILLCVAAYMLPYMHDIQSKQMVIWFSAIASADFIFFTNQNCYWAVLLVPFMTLLIFFDTYHWRLLAFLDWVLSGCFIICEMFRQPGVFAGPSTFEKMLFRNLGRQTIKGQNVFVYLLRDRPSTDMVVNNLFILKTIMLACLVTFFFISSPYRKKVEYKETSGTAILWARWLSALIIWLIEFYVLIIW